MTTAPARQAPTPRVVTAEDEAKARKATAELERVENQVTTVLVTLGFGGLMFTAVNVTLFAIDHQVHWSIAWMLDPLVSISLLAALFIDGKLAAHGYRPGGWPFILRWFAGLSTWLMNCWGALYPNEKFTGWPHNADPAGLLLHSVIPFLVIILAEAGAGWRRFSLRKKKDHAVTLNAWKDQEGARRQREQAERKQREDNDRATAEAERKRAADLANAAKLAAIETTKARDLGEAKAREIRAAEEAEARRVERDLAAAETRSRLDAEAQERQARINRETATHAAELDRLRIIAEAQAEGEKAKVQAELKAAEDAKEERRKTAEARRAQTALPAREATALPESRSAIPTALPALRDTAKPRKLTAIPDDRTAETDDVRGAEAKRKQIEEATFEAAVLNFMDAAPTRKDFAAQYGRGETWGRDRYADAERLMAEDADYAARVLGAAEQRTPAGAPAEDEQVSA